MKPNARISESLLLIKISVIVIAYKQFLTLRDAERDFFCVYAYKSLKIYCQKLGVDTVNSLKWKSNQVYEGYNIT